MTLSKLKEELSEIGQVVAAKEGLVLTIFMRGGNLSKASTLSKIQQLILEYAEEKYPMIEVFMNDNDFLLAVLKPK